jgi:hypothetical protein
MTFARLICIFTCLAQMTFQAHAQIVIHAMVVDSVTLDPLPGTSIKLKRSKQGTATDANGFFTMISPTYDTLILSRIGYQTQKYPLLSSEQDVMILLREEVSMLKEVVVNFYSEEKVMHSAPRHVRTLTVGDAFQSPFTYFSKTEKEKRMLVRLQAEQQKVQVFLDLVTRPQFKAEIMETFSITEESYYDLLAKFNIENKAAQYLQVESEIKKHITAFFERFKQH